MESSAGRCPLVMADTAKTAFLLTAASSFSRAILSRINGRNSSWNRRSCEEEEAILSDFNQQDQNEVIIEVI